MSGDLLSYFDELHAEYGDAVSFRIGPVRMHWFFHPQHVSEILVKNASAFRKLSSVKLYFRRWMGAGLLLNEGEDWRRQRRKVSWALAQVDPAAVGAAVAAETRSIAGISQATEVDIAAFMDRLAFGLNVRALLGGDAERVNHALHAAANELHTTGVREMTSFSMTPDWWPSMAKSRLRRAMRVFDDVLLSMAAKRRGAPRIGADVMRDLLFAVDRQNPAIGMSDRRACDEAVNLLMGGKETVGATLAFACYLLATHGEIQARAAREARGVLCGRAAEVADLERLPYVQMILQETMRLYPPVYALSREAAETVEIAGYRIPRGSLVMVPVYSIHRDARWHDDPTAFDPERFRPELHRQRPPYSFVPFGAGPRGCVGKQIGYQQCALVLATLLANVSFRLAEGQGAPALATDIVLHPRDALRLVVERRRDSQAHATSMR